MLNSKQYAKNIGAVIKAARIEAGMAQADLAEAIDINRTYLSGIENGSRSPGLINLVLISAAFKIPLSELISRAETLAASGK